MADEDSELDLGSALGAAAVNAEQILTVWVPGADRNGKPLPDQEEWIQKTAELPAHIGGGVTILPPVRGGWLPPEGEIVWEEPVLVYTYVDPDSFLAYLPALRDLLHSMGRGTDQGEIVCAFDGIMYKIRDYD